MGWDKGLYYSRSRRVNGRVVREYVGTGPAGQQAARNDALGRQARQARREHLRALQGELEALEVAIKRYCEHVEYLAAVALLLAGYHRPKRGDWRKRHAGPRTAGKC